MLVRSFFACVLLTTMSTNSDASSLYSFVEVDTGETLATLEFSALPATNAEIVAFTFSESGESLFGFASPYSGGFDGVTMPGAVDDGSGGISGGSIFDDTPLDSTRHTFNGTDRFELSFSDSPDEDTISVSPHLGQPHDIHLFARGNWVVVPEPSLNTMCVLFVFLACRLRRHR